MTFIQDLRTVAEQGYQQSYGRTVDFNDDDQPVEFCPIAAVAHLSGYQFDCVNTDLDDMVAFLEREKGYSLRTICYDLPNPLYGPRPLEEVVITLCDSYHYDYRKIADYLEANKLCK